MENEVKEPAPKYNYISPEEYLEMERADEKRNEYYDGHVVEMSGASFAHNMIGMNLARKISNFLDDKNCRMMAKDMRVGTPTHDAYMYPDALIYCDKAKLENDKFDTILNPSIIIEILSPSTKNMDKKRKFIFCREIPSLKEYIMIDSTKKSIIAVRRQPDDSWKFQDINETDSELILETICYNLPLSEIYKDTEL
jgi:Uma2 family endonuclease